MPLAYSDGISTVSPARQSKATDSAVTEPDGSAWQVSPWQGDCLAQLL